VFSGRLWIAAGLLAVMLVVPFTCSRLFNAEPEKGTDVSQWRVGETANVRITLITADFNLLACASDQAINGKHCAYKTESEPWPADPAAPLDDNKATLIQPYRTYPDNKLIMVAGLWADPTMALRLHREPSAGVRATSAARHQLQGALRRQLDATARWQPGQPWQSEGPALVAEPIECNLTDK
jgi:hypothetical protein